MFTYFLLKKLQQTQGEVSYRELSDYIVQEVKRNSIVKNGKSQTPVITPSAACSDEWQGWRLK